MIVSSTQRGKNGFGPRTGDSHWDGNVYHDRSYGRHVDHEYRPDGDHIDHQYGRNGWHVDHEYTPDGEHIDQDWPLLLGTMINAQIGR